MPRAYACARPPRADRAARSGSGCAQGLTPAGQGQDFEGLGDAAFVILERIESIVRTRKARFSDMRGLGLEHRGERLFAQVGNQAIEAAIEAVEEAVRR